MTTLTEQFRRFAVVWSGALGLVVAVLSIPVIEGWLFPVVVAHRVSMVRQADGSVVVSGLMEKRRLCQITELYAMGGTPLRMLHMERGDNGGAPQGRLYSRPQGLQEFGPWTIRPAPPAGSTIEIFVWHDCGAPWRIHTSLARRSGV